MKKELERMQNLSVIKPVGEATEKCTPIFIVINLNGDLRICTNLTKLTNGWCYSLHEVRRQVRVLAAVVKYSFILIHNVQISIW